MSGFTPDWIKRGQYFKLNGEKVLVDDYFFTSNAMPNSDNLNVVVGGKSYEFNTAAMKPLDARGYSVPAHIKPGQLVELASGQVEFVDYVWVSQFGEKGKAEVKVKLENYPFSVTLDQIHPVSSKNSDIAWTMIQAREAKKARIKSLAKFRKLIFGNR